MTFSRDELETLKTRVDRLERGNRRLRRWGAFACLGIGALFLLGQTGRGEISEVVEARRFVVKDAGGRNIAALGTDRDGAPVLVLTNVDGGLAATLDTTAARKPTLTLYDRSGKSRAVLGVDADGSPGLSLNDKNGDARVGLAVATVGSGGLALYGDGNTVRASIGLGTGWSPYLAFLDDRGNIRAALGHSEVFPPALTQTFRLADYSMLLLSAKGDMLWSAPQKEIPAAPSANKAAAKAKLKPNPARR